MRRSVCMATYNGARYLHEQVESILSQIEHDDELIVVDDCSSDGTPGLLRALGDPRLKVQVNERNVGPIHSFERALAAARGELVFLADQDDVWLPGRVQVMSEALQHCDLVVSDCRVVDQALAVIQPSFFARLGSGPGITRNLARNTYLGCCIAFRRPLLAAALPFPPRLPMHDWWLGLIAELYGHVNFLPQQLLLYRRHAANASTAAGHSTASWSTRLLWRLRLVGALLGRRLRVREIENLASRVTKDHPAR